MGRIGERRVAEPAEAAGFEVLITTDKNLRYQQNLQGRKIAIVVLGLGRWTLIRPHVAEVVPAVKAATPWSFAEMDIPYEQGPHRISERVVFATNASERCFLSSHELAGCGNAAPEVRGKPFGNAQTITIFSPLSAFISRENRCTCRVESQRFPAVYDIDSTECGV